jgi:hypothetical protein
MIEASWLAHDGFQGGGQSWEKIRGIEPPRRQEDAEKKRLENPGQNPLSDPLLPLRDLGDLGDFSLITTAD